MNDRALAGFRKANLSGLAERQMNFMTKMILISAVVFLLICVIAGGLAVAFLLSSPSEPITQPPAQIAPPPSAWYQLYFTTPKYPDRAADHRGGLPDHLTAFINTATKSVDMAIYQLDLANVTQALLDARQRGATVRVVTGTDILDDPKENPAFKQLQKAGIVVVAGNPHAIMHNKFVILDRAAVWTGSWNFTENDAYRYNNNGIAIQSVELARNYTATFEKMFNDKKFGGARKPGGTTPRLTIDGSAVENYFAPEDKVAAKIIARLKKAARTIEFMAFSFTHDEMGDALLERAQAGVQVRGVFETTGSETRFSEFERLKKAGLDVMQDGNPYLMHHKVFIIDGRTVILGSFNFSANANESNDENVLIIDDLALAQQFQAEFARVYAQAKNPPKK
jgi:phosphatidylserine/phosphatidylglycerophosphate/cardiolipin synthase-like enzyme